MNGVVLVLAGVFGVVVFLAVCLLREASVVVDLKTLLWIADADRRKAAETAWDDGWKAHRSGHDLTDNPHRLKETDLA